jgi:hypothetical protein
MVERKIKGVLVVLIAILVIVPIFSNFVSAYICADGQSPPGCDLEHICNLKTTNLLGRDLYECGANAACYSEYPCTSLTSLTYWCYYSGNILTSDDCCWSANNPYISEVYYDNDNDNWGSGVAGQICYRGSFGADYNFYLPNGGPYTNRPGDCDDNNGLIHPGATELCGPSGTGNGKDDDCDGSIDEGCCDSHDYTSCYGGDIYWYDSCGNREEKYRDCGGSTPYSYS